MLSSAAHGGSIMLILMIRISELINVLCAKDWTRTVQALTGIRRASLI